MIVLAFSTSISLPITAGSINSDFHSETDYFRLAEILSDYLIDSDEISPLMTPKKKKVEIYNKENQLVRFGNSDDPVIFKLLIKSDYLTIIDGVEYYRLNS